MVENYRSDGGSPTVSVDANGVISFGQNADIEVAYIHATSVDGGHQVDIVVVNDPNYGVIRLLSNQQADARFNAAGYLFNPDASITPVEFIGTNVQLRSGSNYLLHLYDTIAVSIKSATLIGSIRAFFAPEYGGELTIEDAELLTSVYAENANAILLFNCTNVKDVFCHLANRVSAEGCNLSPEVIARQLASGVQYYDLATIEYYFYGGTNAPVSTWSAQAITDKATIVDNYGMVTYNE